jgi:two-component system cell cycle sensor histidine kinase/response regulator CckA
MARDAEERLTLAISATSDFVWDADLRLGTLHCSPQVAAWLGYAAEAWPPTPWHVIVHPDDKDRVLASVKDVIRGRAMTYDVRHRVVRRSGEVLHVHATGATARDARGAAVRFVGAVRDTTGEVTHEAQRMQAQKLEGLGLLAGGIAHDFNNLLTVLSSSLDLAQRRTSAGEDPGEGLAMASLAVRRATVLTRQLLAYAGRAKLAQRPLDLNEVVGSMGELLGVSVSRKITLDVQLAEKLPAVLGDDAQLQQVVMNLTTNAAEAIGDRSGVVRLRTEVLGQPVGDAPEGVAVCLTVEDDGVGMTEDQQRQMFDPFFSTKGSGRGLGLAALAGILKAHGADIAVHSAVGRGTRVSISFPALPSAAPPARPEPPTGPISRRVLLVDDEPLLLRATSRLLQALGCQVTTSLNGREAVERVSADPDAFDVVLMDLMMPDGRRRGEPTDRRARADAAGDLVERLLVGGAARRHRAHVVARQALHRRSAAGGPRRRVGPARRVRLTRSGSEPRAPIDPRAKRRRRAPAPRISG